ncbi:EAL domain-containing protein [Halotalea alkalilenta]|uniref:EAL domain-containing protein n=1 Tax=Halotalea alkalilenta TaxID=376489 RepID=A0A172YIP7_9GAMM|nr:EAL domain-containing protein [Halotalea alkalilenta]ANF59087.1 hypothetical protein A5892_17795 [Halotalea alkalilenta]
MPLTAVVNYFNAHLDDFNRAARLRGRARFDYDPQHCAVTAELDGITLRPDQVALYDSELSAPVAFESRLSIEDEQGRELNAKALYYTAWEAEEVVFLDRFLRVLHTLDHLARHRPDADGNVVPLILDVHWRHVRAVEASHGQVFESLLAQLGVKPAQIVLRMQAEALLEDLHVRRAVQSFEQRGYRLLVEGLPIDHQHWPLLEQMGVSWIAADPDFLQAALRNRLLQARLDQWIQSAHAAGLKVWLQSFDTPRALEIAWRLGADAVSGARLSEAAREG